MGPPLAVWLLACLAIFGAASIPQTARADEVVVSERAVHPNVIGRSKRQAYNPLLKSLLGGRGMGYSGLAHNRMVQNGMAHNGMLQNRVGQNGQGLAGPMPSKIPGAQRNSMQSMLLMQMFCKYFCEELMEQYSERQEQMGSGSLYSAPKITCMSPVPPVATAPANETKALVKWWPPEGYDVEGKPLKPRQVNGLMAPWGYFPEGNHSVTYSVTDDSTGYSASCNVRFRVEVIRCRKPSWPSGGWRECEHNDVIFGSQCRFGCMLGYELMGSPVLTCMQNGHFNFAPPVCQLKSCPPIRLPANAMAYRCTNGNFYNSVCYLICDSVRGFTARAPAIRTCLPIGQWTSPEPSCKSLVPPKFTSCPASTLQVFAEKGSNSANVSWPEPEAQNANGPVPVKQEMGPPSGSRFSVGSHKIRYTATDADGISASPCSFGVVVDAISCTPPSFQDKYLTSNCSDGFNYGANCSLECTMGLPLEGATEITCDLGDTLEPTWKWTGPPPKCLQRPCAALEAPAHGALLCDKWAGGTLCQMQCQEQYDVPRTLASAHHYVCAFSTGKWSPSDQVPDCTELRRPNRMVLPSELYYYSGACGDQQSLLSIRKQFVESLMASTSWRQACEKDKNCNVDNVSVQCGPVGLNRRRRRRRRRQAVGSSPASSATIVTWDFTVDFHIDKMSVRKAIEHHDRILKSMARAFQGDLDRGQFEINVTDIDASRKSYAYGWTDFVCDEGLLPIYTTASCASCPAGTFFQQNGCSPCPRGSYQPRDAASDCDPCPPGMTTLHTASKNVSLCLQMCTPGTFSPTGTTPCTSCPPGSFQPAEGQQSCLPCPMETKTELPGSKDAKDCKSYDIVVMGPETVTFKKLIRENLENFTFTFWFKANDAGRKTTSFTFRNEENQTFALDLNPQTSLFSLPGGDINIPMLFAENTWKHVTVTWEGQARDLAFFVDGKELVRKSFPEAPSLLIGEGTQFDLAVGFKSATTLHGLALLTELKSEPEVTLLSESCSVQSDNRVISLDDLPISSTAEILVFTPSTCLDSHACHPNPCNGHECTANNTDYTCACRGGYSGVNCSVAPDPCIENICVNGATCLPKGDNYACVCPEDFTGQYCDKPIVHGNWGRWSEWSTCSVTCDDGHIVRMRTCDNPPPGPGGRACEGNATESQLCHNEPCNACRASDLERSYGTMPQCAGDISSLTCNVTCREGLTFVETPPTYRCSDGIWYPSTKVVPCTRASSPRRLELLFEGSFASAECPTADQAAQMEEAVASQLSGVPCVAEGKCASMVTIQSCETQARVRRSVRGQGVVISVALAVNFPAGDLDLENYTSSGAANSQLSSLIEAVDSLERTAKEINDSNFDMFSIAFRNVSYHVHSPDVTITPSVTCTAGSFPRNAVCVACPVGTRMTEAGCKLCDVGTFQDESGSDACKPCPPGFTTEYKGATISTECQLVSTSAQPNTENAILEKDSPRSNQQIKTKPSAGSNVITALVTHLPAIAGSIGALLLVAVVIVIVCVCRRRRRMRKTTESSQIPSWVENFTQRVQTQPCLRSKARGPNIS